MRDLSGTPWRRILLSAREDIWCLVDAQDHGWLTEHSWNVWHGGGQGSWKLYAKRNVDWDRKTVRMHREIMIRSDPKSERFMRTHHVDHINGQSLDNRRANLRWVTAKQNAGNRLVRSRIPSIERIVDELITTVPADIAADMAALTDVPF